MSRLVFFTDENTLGLGKLLCGLGRPDVLYPGHDRLPEVPRGTPDLDWLTIVGERAYIVISRERRIRTRPAELRMYHEHGVRSVWIGAKRDLSPTTQLELFLNSETRLRRLVTKLGAGPWAVAMTPSGIRPMLLLPNPGDQRL